MMIRQEIRLWLIHLFYILFFLFLTHRLFFPSFGMAERCMSYILYPFLKIHATMTHSLQQQAHERKHVHILKDELESLYVQHDVLKGRVMQLEAEHRFWQETHEMIDFAARYNVEKKDIAKVLMFCCNQHEDVIFIDGGKNKNFVKDDIVVYNQTLIGRVIEVYPWYSKIVLVTDIRCRIAAEVSAGVTGISCGKNNKNLELCFVPHFKTVQVGDVVTSTGQGLMYPQGFALGVVSDVKTDLVSHTIQIKPAFDIEQVPYVYVLHKA